MIYGGQGTGPASMDRQPLLLHPSQIVFNGLMAVKVPLETIFIQVRLEGENFLRNLLVFTLNTFEFGLP